MKEKEKDRRLFLPEDEFGGEASEGLGRLSRDEAEEDLRELKGRLRRRVSKPRHIWLQAAAALVVLLIASTAVIYIFREKGVAGTELAMTETVVKDTALIAMAEPVQTHEKGAGETDKKSGGEFPSRAKGSEVASQVAGIQKEKSATGRADEKARQEAVAAVVEEDTDMAMEMAEVSDEVTVPEEVVVEALPMMQRATVTEQATAKKVSADKAAEKPTADKAMAQPAAAMPDRQASPVGGWEKLNNWTRPNISLQGDVKPGVTRAVVVAFKVRADSTLYDLKVVRSADDSYSQAALSMLREGPLWVPAMRDGQISDEEVKVTIVFK